MFGGSGGGGKSFALLMAALQYVDIPGYAALLLRRTYADLSKPSALIDISRQWLMGTDARWNDQAKMWRFPSGATLSFGYLDSESDKWQYQGGTYQFCVAKGTPILMADGSWAAIEDIDIGDRVQTLEGAQSVLRTYRLGRKPVARITSALGEALVSSQHRLLSVFDGWCTPIELLSKQSLPFDNNGGYSLPKYAISSLHHECLYSGRQLVALSGQQNNGEMVAQDCGVLAKDNRNGSAEFGNAHPIIGQHKKSCVPLMLYEQSPQLKGLPSSWYEAYDVFPLGEQSGFPIGYRRGLHSYDVLVRKAKVAVQESIPQLACAVRQNQTYQHEDGQENIPECSHLEYTHPYTKEHRPIYGGVLGLHCDIIQAGEAEVFDLTVSSCSHYIIHPGIIASNCGFDELTQFRELDYRFLFGWLRRPTGSDIPLRMRAASNPGGIGHEWVKQRFLSEPNEERLFLPARLDDNPHLDKESYVQSLMELDPVTRRQILEGDWSARQGGSKFRREWFEVVEAAPAQCRMVRAWDMAATEPKRGNDPDWTAGLLLAANRDNVFYVIDVRRIRGTPGSVEALIKQTAELDGKAVQVRMEQEPGSSGVNVIDHYRRQVLPGFDFRGVPSTGSKEVRANPVASQAEAGNVKLVRGSWINAFLDELESFPGGSHDDQVDALSGAFEALTQQRRLEVLWV